MWFFVVGVGSIDHCHQHHARDDSSTRKTVFYAACGSAPATRNLQNQITLQAGVYSLTVGHALCCLDVVQRVLIVDDHPGTTEALAMLLGLLGHQAHAVHRGADALSAAREIDPHLVLLDISLPDINGYDVARALRDEHGRRSYLVAATGWGRPADRVRAVAAGFDSHLTKPFQLGDLRELLELSAATKR